MLALIKDGAIEQIVGEGGSFRIGDNWTSPAYDGWQNDDGYSLVAVVAPAVPPGLIVKSSTVEMVEGVPTLVYTFDIDSQITTAPKDLFGGPTLGEVYGNV